MQFYLTGDSEGILRIEEEAGAQVTAALSKKEAHIVSISVPQKERHSGMGKRLLSVLSQEAYKRNITSITADFSERLSDVCGLFEACGFSVEEGAPIVSVDMRKLLSSQYANLHLREDPDGFKFISLWKMQTQMDMMQDDILFETGLPLTKKTLTQFQPDLSGFVYDKKEKKAAVVLCSDYGDSVHVDYLKAEDDKDDAGYNAAVRAVIQEITERDGTDRYNSLTYYAIDEDRGSLMRNADYDIFDITLHAKKPVKAPVDTVELIVECSNEDRDEWIEELISVPYAFNICLKNIWCR